MSINAGSAAWLLQAHANDSKGFVLMSKDIIVFTLHKCASMFIHQQCQLLSHLSGMTYNSPNTQNTLFTAQRLLTDRAIWGSHHGCFAPIRFFVDVPDFENYHTILHLRDPRDVLASMFYSYCYIHKGEIAGNTGYRKEAAEAGIDKFVLDKSLNRNSSYVGDYGTGQHLEDLIGNITDRYNDYINHVLGRSNVLFVKYEDMVTNYRGWLEKFIEPFPLSDKSRLIEELVAQSSEFFPERTTDRMAHRRHITPGDHKNKLKASTISQLNEIFGDILCALGYEQ